MSESQESCVHHIMNSIETTSKLSQLIPLLVNVSYGFIDGCPSSILSPVFMYNNIKHIYRCCIDLLMLAIASTKDAIDILCDYQTNLSPLFYRSLSRNIISHNSDYLIPIVALEMKDPTLTDKFYEPGRRDCIKKFYKHLQVLQNQLNLLFTTDDDELQQPQAFILSKKYRKLETYIWNHLISGPPIGFERKHDEETKANIVKFYEERKKFLESFDADSTTNTIENLEKENEELASEFEKYKEEHEEENENLEYELDKCKEENEELASEFEKYKEEHEEENKMLEQELNKYKEAFRLMMNTLTK